MLTANQKLGPYEIQGPLGSGGMGEVYRAKDSRLGREVAVKVLPHEFLTHPERLRRFEREARSASALNHPAIITIYEVGQIDSHPYIAMELVKGKNLGQLLAAGRMPLKKIVSIATQAADGLAKAHEAGIVHRDLKPENLMINDDGFLKILDFGLAKVEEPTGSNTSGLQTGTGAGMVMGTAFYMSPEQASGKAVDFRSDQFSMGSILYEMIAGRRAFARETPPETMAAIIRSDLEPLTAVSPSTPAPLRWIVERCLAKDPGDRYASTRDLARDIQGLRDHLPELTSVSGSGAVIRSPAAKWRLPLAIAALVALFLSALIFGSRLPKSATQEPVVIRTLTYSGSDSSPAVSPNGQLIAFRSDRDGKPRIWLKQIRGGNEIALTEGPDDFPRFSPDGSFLLFIRSEGAVPSLYRIAVLGGDERKVIDDATSADWSPDGKRIAFVRWKPGGQVPDTEFMLVNPDGSEPASIAIIQEAQLHSVRWSPDGRFLIATVLIQGNFGNRNAIALVDVDHKKAQWILSTFSPTSAIWSGTEGQIAYFVPETGVALFQLRGDSMLYIHDVKTGKRKPVFWAQSAGEIMDIAGKGDIVMHSASLRENLREVMLGRGKSPSDVSWLTRGNSCNRQPVYSPDGTRILFSSNMASNLDLWEVNIATRSLRHITEDEAGDWDPAYTPDGKSILWSSNRNGHFEIWMANSDGSGARQVSKDGIDAENPSMTRDGKWILYNSYNPDLAIRGIWKIHPDGSGASRLVDGLTQWPEISPDGRYICYSFYKQSLNDRHTYQRVTEIESGKAVDFEIEVSNRDRVGGRLRWMPDGKSILYLDENSNGLWGVFAQDFVPGTNTRSSRRPVAGFDADRKMDTFTVSPDSSNIVVAEVEILSSLIRASGIPGIEPPRKSK